jgi:hypothetical protein
VISLDQVQVLRGFDCRPRYRRQDLLRIDRGHPYANAGPRREVVHQMLGPAAPPQVERVEHPASF